MAGENTTLLVRHLPGDFTKDDQEDLLKHFGASRVRCMGNTGRMKFTAFATFSSHQAASQALGRLHQLSVDGHRLVVEFAQPQLSPLFPSPLEPSLISEPKEKKDDQKEKEAERIARETENRKKLVDRVNSVSSKWGLDYPLNPALKYLYPPPTVGTLTNIAHALASVPKFYVQVLHLMNKMNLPAPFGAITPAPPIAEDSQMVPSVTDMRGEEMLVSSTEESEMESDDGSIIPKVTLKRPVRHRVKPKIKHKLQKIVSASKPVSRVVTYPMPSQVFEKTDAFAGRKIEFNLSTAIAGAIASATQSIEETTNHSNPDTATILADSGYTRVGSITATDVPVHSVPENSDTLLQTTVRLDTSIRLDSDSITVEPNTPVPPVAPVDLLSVVDSKSVVEQGGFGKIEPQKGREGVVEKEEEEEWGTTEFITSRRLSRGRVQSRELKELSVYRNYKPGDPTSRLYVKNLAKQVTEKDLHYIYGRYIDWNSETEKNMFDIRLMKEGRMKGQAFVTLANDKEAANALHDTNGFTLHEKPMVVQFARSAKPKEEDKKSKGT